MGFLARPRRDSFQYVGLLRINGCAIGDARRPRLRDGLRVGVRLRCVQTMPCHGGPYTRTINLRSQETCDFACFIDGGDHFLYRGRPCHGSTPFFEGDTHVLYTMDRAQCCLHLEIQDNKMSLCWMKHAPQRALSGCESLGFES